MYNRGAVEQASGSLPAVGRLGLRLRLRLSALGSSRLLSHILGPILLLYSSGSPPMQAHLRQLIGGRARLLATRQQCLVLQ